MVGAAILLGLFSSLGQAAIQETVDSQDDGLVGFADDIQQLRSDLPKLHMNLFFQLEEKVFHRELEQLASRLGELSSPEVQLELSRIVASIGDGHTALQLDFNKFDVLPIQMNSFKDGVFIVGVHPDYAQLLGQQVVAIGGVGIEELQDRVGRFVSTDNAYYQQLVVPQYYLPLAAALKLSGADITSGSVSVVVRDADDSADIETDELTVEVKAMAYPEFAAAEKLTAAASIPLFEQKENLNYWYQRLEESDVIYFKYRRCQGITGIVRLQERLMAELDERPPRALIVDLRLNGGGNSLLIAAFLEYLKSNETLNQSERLFVVLGPKTFSSAVLNAIEFKQKTRATLVGQPTGGRPNHFGEVKFLQLENTGLRVSYSTKYFRKYADGDPDTIQPEVLIQPTFDDYRTGRDPVLEWVLTQSAKEK